MSYESAVVIFVVFLIPTGIFVVTRMIRLKQQEKSEQAELDMMFSSHEDDRGDMTFKSG